LTGGKRKLLLGHHFLITGLSESTSPTKSSVTNIIRNHGGKLVADLVAAAGLGDISLLYVIAFPRATKLTKYIWAVAKGVSILHPQWLIMSTELNALQRIEDYTLPIGFSYRLDMFLFRDMGMGASEKQTMPFEELHVLILHDQEDFVQGWQRIMNAGGASKSTVCASPRVAYQHFPNQKMFQALNFSCIITDHTLMLPRSKRKSGKPPPFFWDIISFAEASFLPVLSYEWAIQSLIHKERIDWNAPDIDHRLFLNWAAYEDPDQYEYTQPFSNNHCYGHKIDLNRYDVGDFVIVAPLSSGSNKQSSSKERFGRILQISLHQSGHYMFELDVYERAHSNKRTKSQIGEFALRNTGKQVEISAEQLNGRFILLDKETFKGKRYTSEDNQSSFFYLQSSL